MEHKTILLKIPVDLYQKLSEKTERGKVTKHILESIRKNLD